MPEKMAQADGPGRGATAVAPKAPRSELVIIPTYKRNAHLHCCLSRIRKQDAKIPIMVFSDRGENNLELRSIVREFQAGLVTMPQHNFHGNSFCVMEALRLVSMRPPDLIHVNEDDTMQHPDCLAWHREQHDLIPDIFASCGWVFNLQAPIADGIMFAPWFYAPNYAINKAMLGKIVQHANPRYYHDMRGYVLRTFPDSILTNCGRQFDTMFYEQDAIIQFCLMQDGSQVVWNGTAKVDHVGAHGYNKGDGRQFLGPLDKAVAELEEFIADPYERMAVFGRPVVEREVGHELPKRRFVYKVTVPGGWETEYISELSRQPVMERIHSVRLPQGTLVEAI